MATRNRQALVLTITIVILAQLFTIPASVYSAGTAASPLAHALTTPIPSQTQLNPDCLVPSSGDFSNAKLMPSTTGSSTSISTVTIPGTTVTDVRLGKASLLAPLKSSAVLHLSVVFKIRNQDSFNNCLAAINDPTSPFYRQFLNATTLAPYVQTPGVKASVMSYLSAGGVTVSAGPSPLIIQLTGNVTNLQRLLNLHLNLYRTGNHTFYSADSDPSFPQNYADMVTTITGLDNYTTVKHLETPCGPAPNNPYCAQAVQAGYSMGNLYSNGFNGNGITVAVVDMPGDPNPSLALSTYDSTYALQPPSSFQVLCGGNTSWGTCDSSVSYDSGWASEAAMDIEAAHAMAPGAAIKLFYGYFSNTDPLIDAIDYIAANHVAPIVSNSWTYGVDSLLQVQVPGWVSSVDHRLAIDAAQGLTILFASGDSGAESSTEFPASDANVLAVGATDLAMTGCGNTSCTSYGGEQGSVISGGGYSAVIPEPTWQASAIGLTPKGYGGHGRGVPDVSMLGYIPGYWVYASWSNQCGVAAAQAGWFGCSGTSLSTPLWAGFLAVALQADGGGNFGNIDPTLYKLGAGSSYTSIFHDVTAGSNGLYSAGIGWDAVTGWGSPIGDKLAGALTSAPPTPTTPTLTVSYNIIGGGTPSAPTFNYIQNGAFKNLKLTKYPTALVVDANSAWSVVPNPLSLSSSSQRWEADAASLQGIASASASIVFTYYHQYPIKLSYSLAGGGNPTPPSFTANQLGVSTPQLLTKVVTGPYWFDAGSQWSMPTPLGGSSSTEQWKATVATTGTVVAAKTMPFTYQRQYYLAMSSNSTGGTVSPNSGWQNAGVSVTIKATPKPGYVFKTWAGTGIGSYTGGTTSATVKMNGPITEVGQFALPALVLSQVTPASAATVSPTQSTTLTVRVTANGAAVTGANVTVFVNGSTPPGCSGKTNSNGYFSCSFQTQPNITYTWYATANKVGYQPGTSTSRTFKT